MLTIRNPADRAAPETYHHGIEVAGPVRTLYIAGQIGVRADGTIPEGIAAQAETVFANMRAVLDAAGMDFTNVVKTVVFLLHPADRAGYAVARAAAFGAHRATSTLLYVAGLARPELLIEVEAVAVAPLE